MGQYNYMRMYERKNGLTIMDKALNKLPALKGKEIASSLKFYFTQVKKDHAHMAE